MKIEREEVISWAKDIGEVLLALVAIIIVSKLLFGPDMLIPLVAVTSQSMLHTSDAWSAWLVERNISAEKVESFPLQGGFARGDMIVTITPNKGGVIHPFFSDTGLGDVVIYERDKEHSPYEPPIIHRVIGIVEVRDWQVTDVEGTVDCLSVEGLEQEYIPKVEACVQGGACPYFHHPDSGDFRFFVTKGDNNDRSDQCSGISYPVTDRQLTARGLLVIPYVGYIKLLLNAIVPL